MVAIITLMSVHRDRFKAPIGQENELELVYIEFMIID